MSDRFSSLLHAGFTALAILLGVPYWSMAMEKPIAQDTVAGSDSDDGALILLGDGNANKTETPKGGALETPAPWQEAGQIEPDAPLVEESEKAGEAEEPKTGSEVKKTEPETSTAAESFAKARILLEQGKLEQAVQGFANTLALRPESVSAYWFRSDALARLGRVAESQADYRKVVELTHSPGSPDAYRARGYALLQLGEYENALADFDEVLAARPDDPHAHLYRGATLEAVDRLEEAVVQYSELIRLTPKHGSGYLKRGNLRMKMGQYDAGLGDQKRAIRLGQLEGAERFGQVELLYIDPTSSIVFRFVFVPPGQRWVGYTEEQRVETAVQSRQLMFGYNAVPRYTIELREGYFILDREVTMAQFAVFCHSEMNSTTNANEAFELLGPAQKASDAEPAGEAASGSPEPDSPHLGQEPVRNVSWHQAMAFCLAMQEPIGLVVRLPTEIEWECAARTQPEWVYPWGPDDFYAWAEKGPDTGPRPVAADSAKDRTPSGLYDMSGNLSEWCYDTYENQLLEANKPSIIYIPAAQSKDQRLRTPGPRRVAKVTGRGRPAGLVPDPRKFNLHIPADTVVGETERATENTSQDSVRRTYRGGSYQDNRFNCQIPVRRSMPASEGSPTVGFRPVLLMRFTQ